MEVRHNILSRCRWIVIALFSIPLETLSSCHTNYVTHRVRTDSGYVYDYNYQNYNYEDIVISAAATCNYSSLYNPKHYEISPSYDQSQRWDQNPESTYSLLVMSSYIIKYQEDIFIFSSSAKLVKIALVDCNVQKIEVGSFKSLQTLKEITFESNNITVLYNGTFGELKDLEVLCLARNNISKLDEGVFNDLANLKLLNLSYNILNVVEDELFLPLDSLETLDLSWNRIITVEDTLNISSLKSLYLNHNDIVRVTNATFKFLVRLEVLSLSGNKISELPSGIGNHMGTLIELNLSGNRLKAINFTSLVGLKSLKVLNLSNNDILDISSHAFYNTPSLQVFSLSNNSLVDVGELANIMSLISIDFDGNSFKCTSLLRTIYLLEQRNVLVHKGNNSEGVNIHGIACRHIREGKAECTDGDQIGILEEYLVRSDERVEKLLKGQLAKLESAFLSKILELKKELRREPLQEHMEIVSSEVPPTKEPRSADVLKPKNFMSQEQGEILDVNVKQLNTLSSIFVLLLVLFVGFLLLVVLLLVSRIFTTKKKAKYPDNLTEMEEIE